MDTILSSSRSVLELSWKNPREWDWPTPYCTFPESLGSPLEAVLMGNITKRGSKGRAADGPKALEGSTAATLHVQLCEAIMRQDCAALRALLRSHPVNQPMTILTSSTGCSLANSRLFLSQVLASPARSLSALSMPQARQCAPSCVLPSRNTLFPGTTREAVWAEAGLTRLESLHVILSNVPRLHLCAGITSPFLTHTFFIVWIFIQSVLPL